MFQLTYRHTGYLCDSGLMNLRSEDIANNLVKVDWGNGRGWAQCRQRDFADSPWWPICGQEIKLGTFDMRIDGRVDGLIALVDRAVQADVIPVRLSSWGNVTLATTNTKTLFSNELCIPEYKNGLNLHLRELEYLAPVTGTRALERLDPTYGSQLFYGARKLVGDLSGWRVPFTGSISGMFEDCREFNQPLDAWPVRGLTDLSRLLYGARKFNQPLSTWDVAAATSFTDMLNGACSFNQSLAAWAAPRTWAGCQELLQGSYLLYSQLPAACGQWAQNTYTWGTKLTRAECLAA